MKRLLLTVSGKDRPGIISQVSGLLFQLGCNLEDISMTLLEGQFAMMMTFGIPSKISSAALNHIMRKLTLPPWEMSCFLTGLKGTARRGRKHSISCLPCVITAFGKDRTGIVHEVSRTLAAKGINITDLDCRILGKGNKSTYAMILEVDVPKRIRLADFQKILKRVAEKLKIEIQSRTLEPLSI